MKAHIAPNANSSSQSSDNPDQPGLFEDGHGTVEYDADYVPEREFVLMPLFRRIGEMLGLRKHQEQDYIYVPEAESTSQATIAQEQAESASIPGLQRVRETQRTEVAPVASRIETDRALSVSEAGTSAEDILEIEPLSASESGSPNQVWASPEQFSDPALARFQPLPETVEPLPEPVLRQADVAEAEAQPAAIQAEPGVIEAQSVVAESEAGLVKEAAPREEAHLIAAQVETPQPAAATSAITPQQANDLAAQIREAAARISTAVSQAAEWLHSKEEEILLRQKTQSAQQKPIAAESATAPMETRAQVAQLEDKQAPALQRELGWRDEGASLQQRAGVALPAKAGERKKRLQLVSKPAALSFWKRIDWAAQFAPMRVAILGGLVMAILMVVGISLARRPAASVLPQQTRTIEPGGVTLTTHPTTLPAASSPAQPQRKVVESHASTASTRQQAHRSRQSDDGPDVVTHYYRKSKPSPIHQSTVAGVRHYSDMQQSGNSQ